MALTENQQTITLTTGGGKAATFTIQFSKKTILFLLITTNIRTVSGTITTIHIIVVYGVIDNKFQNLFYPILLDFII